MSSDTQFIMVKQWVKWFSFHLVKQGTWAKVTKRNSYGDEENTAEKLRKRKISANDTSYKNTIKIKKLKFMMLRTLRNV